MEFFEPSQAAYVNVSVPMNPSLGKYVRMLLLTPSEPLAGWEMIRSVAVGGVTVTLRFDGALFRVFPKTTLTVGAALLLTESLFGPL